MSKQGDGLHEAIRVAGASVGNPEDNVAAAALAVEAVIALGYGIEDPRGWSQLAVGLMNLNMLLLSELEVAARQAPLDTLHSIATTHPRAGTI